MKSLKITKDEFRESLKMNGHDHSDSDCEEVMNEFISNYNNMFEGKDSVGNPTHSEIKDNVVVIHYIDSDSFTVGDIETIIDDFLFQL